MTTTFVRHRRIALSGCTLLGATMLISNAWAGVDAIDISARKRSEAMASAPISVAVIDALTIRRLNVSDLSDIAALTAGLQYDEGASSTDVRLSVRGISSSIGRPSVALVVDGIDVSSEALRSPGGSLLMNPRLLDLERIEVVKGPETALYGRNAMNGVIQLVTKDPSQAFEAELRGDGGNYGRAEAEASVSGPLIGDVLGIRVNASFWNEHGAYENAVTSVDLDGGGQGWSGGLTLKYTPTSALSFKAHVSYADDDYTQLAQAPVEANDILSAPSLALADNNGALAGTQSVIAVNPGLDAGAGADPRNGLPLFSDSLIPAFVGDIPNAGYVVRYSPDFIKSGGDLSAISEYAGADRQDLRASLVIDWDIGVGTLSSLTHYGSADVSNVSDFDKRALGFHGTPNKDETALQAIQSFDNDTTVYSQDLRFASAWSRAFQLTVGALRWVESVEQKDRGGALIAQGARCVLPGDCPGFTGTPAYSYVDDFFAAQTAKLTERETRQWSGYGVLEFDLDELGLVAESMGQWSLRTEARYVRERQRLDGPTPTGYGSPEDFVLCGPSQSCSGFAVPTSFVAQALVPTADAPLGYVTTRFERTEHYWTPKVSLQWQPSDDSLIYFSFSASKRPGGFATLGIASAGLDPNKNGLADETELSKEKLNVYEIGAKTALFDRTLQLNAATFYEKLSDKQVAGAAVIGDVLTPVFSNAGEAHVFGVELDATWQPNEHWSVYAGYSFLAGKYDDFDLPTSDPFAIAASGCDSVVPYATVNSSGAPTTTYQCVVDYSGNKLESTPNHAAVSTVEYEAPLIGRFDWIAGATIRYQGRRYLTPDNLAKLEPYVETDIRLGIKGEHWEVLLYADNLFDNDKVKSATVMDDIGGPSVYRMGSSATEAVAHAKLVKGVIANMPRSFQYGGRMSVHF